MKGVILAGGSGSRLQPLTKITSKQLLPVYDKPMIFYPLETLLNVGIREIFIIVAPDHSGDFLNLLGSGREFNAKFTYEIQDAPAGLAHGLSLAEAFADHDSVTMILGDNIFEENVSKYIQSFSGTGAMAFAKEVPDPKRFGVIEMDEQGNVLSIEEKPEHPKSQLAQVGLYVYDNHVFDYIRALKPSSRGELEITDLNNVYLQRGEVVGKIIEGEWIDAGTFDALLRAGTLMAQKAKAV